MFAAAATKSPAPSVLSRFEKKPAAPNPVLPTSVIDPPALSWKPSGPLM